MKYILRYYQKEAVEAGVNFFLDKKDKKNKIIVEPTGAGKSLIIANIAKELNDFVLVLQPSKELLLQNYHKYINYGLKASIFSASVGIKEISQVTFATIGSIYKKPELFKQFKNIIIDECHKVNPRKENLEKGTNNSMYNSLFSELDCKVLGLTATPFRLKSYNFPEPHSKLNFLNRMRPRVFHDVIHITQINEMVENNWWAKLNYVQEPFDTSKLRINTTGADYTEVSVRETLKFNKVPEKAIYWAKKLIGEGRKQIIIFMPSIIEANYVAHKLGVDTINSTTKPKDRQHILSKFEAKNNFVITNVNVLSIGYDNQQIDGIIDCTPTLSLAMYYQKLGRGVRIDLSPNPTKTDCTVIDLCGNFDLFGRVENLEIKQLANKWVVCSGDKVLTNTPIIKDETIPELSNEIMPFGKFKNKTFKDVPVWYWKYIAKNFENNSRNEKLFQYITLKNIV